MKFTTINIILSSLILINCAFSQQLQPAIIASIDQSGADYIQSVVFPLIISRVANVSIPDISGEKDGFDYGVNGITIQSLSYTSASVSINGVPTLTITGLSVAIHCNWNFQLHIWPHTPYGSGSADISVSQSSLTLSLNVDASNGQPQITVQNVNVNLNAVDISVHGSAWSWLANLLTDLFNSQIKSAAASQIQSEITSLVDVFANQVLSTLPLHVPVSSDLMLYFNLVQNPTFSNDVATAYFEGAFENVTNPVYPPIPHGGITPMPMTKMASGDIDEFLINSGLWTAYETQTFLIYATDAEVPPESPIRLNTSTFRFNIPSLYAQYPNDLLELVINATRVPSVSISPNGTLVDANFDITWVVNQTTSFPTAFVMNMEMQFFLTLDINTTSTALQGELKLLQLTVSIVSSNIGAFDPTLLQNFMKGIIGGPIVEIINQYLARGIKLPTVEGLTLVNPVLSQQNGFVHVDTDFTFVPPSFAVKALDAHVMQRSH